jgi:hypothetical protein
MSSDSDYDIDGNEEEDGPCEYWMIIGTNGSASSDFDDSDYGDLVDSDDSCGSSDSDYLLGSDHDSSNNSDYFLDKAILSTSPILAFERF